MTEERVHFISDVQGDRATEPGQGRLQGRYQSSCSVCDQVNQLIEAFRNIGRAYVPVDGTIISDTKVESSKSVPKHRRERSDDSNMLVRGSSALSLAAQVDMSNGQHCGSRLASK